MKSPRPHVQSQSGVDAVAEHVRCFFTLVVRCYDAVGRRMGPVAVVAAQPGRAEPQPEQHGRQRRVGQRQPGARQLLRLHGRWAWAGCRAILVQERRACYAAASWPAIIAPYSDAAFAKLVLKWSYACSLGSPGACLHKLPACVLHNRHVSASSEWRGLVQRLGIAGSHGNLTA